jgi:hypothetical protein
MAAVFGFVPVPPPEPEELADEPPRGRYGSYGSDLGMQDETKGC